MTDEWCLRAGGMIHAVDDDARRGHSNESTHDPLELALCLSVHPLHIVLILSTHRMSCRNGHYEHVVVALRYEAVLEIRDPNPQRDHLYECP
jgi:hypothetical protein